ncbi:RNA-binding S4 domain-containing protein [Sphingomonas panacisoli]|uniref:RNA-binding S4 domain-containing protein n=1 Tax=Sphingomonas panacisoli TaxID=1813879 RepID=A0A5B8LLT8_9SPHN|nr:RNA-binding S4 domain-containing protein [Sphingomonas panacisoli]QDZ08544.1 RNA-binding S4 domain-containing protein [Sphingomonas panacisoli]
MADSMRLDKFLWFARIVKTRSFAQAMAEQGHLRIDGRPIDRAAAPVRIGNILTFATHRGEVRTIRIEALPVRRGPPTEASACFQDLTPGN